DRAPRTSASSTRYADLRKSGPRTPPARGVHGYRCTARGNQPTRPQTSRRPPRTMSEADIVRVALFPIMVVAGFLIHRSDRHVIGRWLLLIGTLHLTGLWVGRHAVAGIVAGGVIGQADSGVGHIVDRANQELIFWFALWGVWTIFVGQFVSILEDRGLRVPAWFGWQFFICN